MAGRGDSPIIRNVVIGREQLERSKKGEVVCKTGIFDDQGALQHLDLDSDKLLKEVHLVLFVIDSGRITDRTFDNINICKEYQCVSEISALLLVGCEGKSDEAQDIVNGFRGDAFTRDVVCFMQQGIYAVGFPDISETDSSIKETFTEGMTKDAKFLHEMVMNQKRSVDFGEIFSKSEGQSPHNYSSRTIRKYTYTSTRHDGRTFGIAEQMSGTVGMPDMAAKMYAMSERLCCNAVC